MRIFVAIALPADIKEALAKLQKSGKDIKWQPTRQMHITLRFCGESSGVQLKELKHQLAMLAAQAFRLAVGGLGAFPDKEHPKVVWAGLEKTEPLTNLQHKIEQCCRNSGFDSVTQPFIPHITLGRLKSNDFDFAKLCEREIPGANEFFDVNYFGLYSSKLTANGAVHTLLKKYALSA